MRFEFLTGGIVEISEDALATLYGYRQTKPEDKEAGGVLLGRLIKDSTDIVIDVAAPPDKSDSRKRFWFFRKRAPAQKIINQAWKNTTGTQNYLGEWHTHPEPSPTPSQHDLNNWVNIGDKSKYAQDFLIFIIVGTSEVGAWMFLNGEILHLPQVNNV